MQNKSKLLDQGDYQKQDRCVLQYIAARRQCFGFETFLSNNWNQHIVCNVWWIQDIQGTLDIVCMYAAHRTFKPHWTLSVCMLDTEHSNHTVHCLYVWWTQDIVCMYDGHRTFCNHKKCWRPTETCNGMLSMNRLCFYPMNNLWPRRN